jgi:hypothetical protein
MSNARDRILARRAKFMAAAFVGIAGCSDNTSPQPTPQVCLTGQAYDTGVDTRDAADTEPVVCLTSPADTSVDDGDATDTEPMVCLSAPLDTGTDDGSAEG